jgi:hypothetical protein
VALTGSTVFHLRVTSDESQNRSVIICASWSEAKVPFFWEGELGIKSTIRAYTLRDHCSKRAHFCEFLQIF